MTIEGKSEKGTLQMKIRYNTIKEQSEEQSKLPASLPQKQEDN